MLPTKASYPLTNAMDFFSFMGRFAAFGKFGDSSPNNSEK